MFPGTSVCAQVWPPDSSPQAPGQGSRRVEIDKGYRRTDTKTPAPPATLADTHGVNQPPSSVFLCYPTHNLKGQRHVFLTAWKLRAGLPRPSGQPNFLPVWAGLCTQ